MVLFLRMHTKEIAKNMANIYSDRKIIPILQEIWVAEANGEVRFLTGSSKIGASAHAQWTYAQNSLIVLSNRHNFNSFIGNRGRWTRRYLNQI